MHAKVQVQLINGSGTRTLCVCVCLCVLCSHEILFSPLSSVLCERSRALVDRILFWCLSFYMEIRAIILGRAL